MKILGGIMGPCVTVDLGRTFRQGPCFTRLSLHLGSDIGLDHKMKCYSRVILQSALHKEDHGCTPPRPQKSWVRGRDELDQDWTLHRLRMVSRRRVRTSATQRAVSPS